MNASPTKSFVLTAAALLVASSAAFADPLTRADVAAQTIAARQQGTLAPNGQLAQRQAPSSFAGAPLARAEVVAEVVAARASGTLSPAGEGPETFTPLLRTPEFQFTRAQVKAEVIAARNAGELNPAGEGPSGAYRVSHPRHRAQVKSAGATDSGLVAKR